MPTPSHSLEAIEDFLAQKRFAMVGVSRDAKDFSVTLFEELCRRGYEVIPVNPNASNVLGRRCYPRVRDIQPPVTAALLMTTPQITEAVVDECAKVGINRIWMYSAGSNGAVSQQALDFCAEHGIRVVPGECPFMFLPEAGFGHRLHGFIRKITGHYPRRQAA